MGALLQILFRALPKSEEDSDAEYEVDNNIVTCTFCSTVAALPPREALAVDHPLENTQPEERHEAVHLD
jgi:hypothetical protein